MVPSTTRPPRLDRRHREHLSALALAAPALLGLVVFVVVPLVLGGYCSLTDKRLHLPPADAVGRS